MLSTFFAIQVFILSLSGGTEIFHAYNFLTNNSVRKSLLLRLVTTASLSCHWVLIGKVGTASLWCHRWLLVGTGSLWCHRWLMGKVDTTSLRFHRRVAWRELDAMWNGVTIQKYQNKLFCQRLFVGDVGKGGSWPWQIQFCCPNTIESRRSRNWFFPHPPSCL